MDRVAEMIRRRSALVAAVVLVVSAGAMRLAPGLHVAADALPRRINDQTFWRMIDEFSEPGGFFRSDNLISNETEFQHVIPELEKRTPVGGVYLGVGPDQNFTYIVATRPRVAFIIDIRRQNMLLHLMYKALIELSDDRAEFLSRLFARKQPPGIGPKSTAKELFDAYMTASPSDELQHKNLKSVVDRLVKHHGFRLTPEDIRSIEYVYTAFCAGGPDLRYSFPRGFGFGGRFFPTYAELMMETDEHGQNHSYMATEDNFRVLKELEKNNLIVPVVGDFGGDKAIRSVGGYLREHGATVTAFYTSNVEQYLFQSDAWRRFFANVGTLPIDGSSTFIRAYFNTAGFRYQTTYPGLRSATLLDPIGGLLAAFRDGKIQTYYDVVERSHP